MKNIYKKLLQLCISIYFLILFSVPLFGQAFTHPGILNNKTELDIIKSKLTTEPWKTAFTQLKASSYASLTYSITPFDTVACGSFNNPNIGCNQFVENAMAAYTHALLWYLTDNQANADKAIAILNAWSNTYVTNIESNARLEVAWAAPWYVNAAEIIRYSNAGWKATDITKFTGMLNKFLPFVLDETMPGNNWIQSAIEAHIAIAVFKDDRTQFNNAIQRWKDRVATYIYETTDGPVPITIPGKTSAQTISIWKDGATNLTYVNGLAMETCRDLGHLKLGFNSMMYAAEIAWQQGTDLFTLEKKRITDFLELHGSWMTGSVAVPSNICDGKIVAALADANGIAPPTGGGEAAFEIAYNHLHDRLNTTLPYTLTMLNGNRPTNANKWVFKWETLTHGNRSFDVPNEAPVVTLVKPDTNYFSVYEGYSLSIEAIITDNDKNFSYSTLFINSDSIRNEATAPYEWGHATSPNPNEINNLLAGDYIIKVVGTDTKGARGFDSFTLHVKENKVPYLGTPTNIPGTIEMENYDKGGEGVSYHETTIGNAGKKYRTDNVDIDTIPNTYTIGWTATGEWLEYTVNVAKKESYNFEFLTSSLNGGGLLSIAVDGTPLKTGISIPKTSNWTTYSKLNQLLILTGGQHILRFTIENAGFNIDKITITQAPKVGPAGYDYAVDEYTTIPVTGTVNIAYGVYPNFVYLYNQTTNTPCTTAAFGGIDPATGITKSCYVQHAIITETEKNKALAYNTISVHPNPATTQLRVNSNQLHVNKIKLIDLQGRIIYQDDNAFSLSKSIDLAGISNGIYFIHIHTDNVLVIRKIIINK